MNSRQRGYNIITISLLELIISIMIFLYISKIDYIFEQSGLIINLLDILGCAGLIFGINAFIKRKFIMKLSLKILYPVYFNDNIIVSIIDYLSIFILFIMIGYGIFNIVKIIRKKEIK